MGPSGVRGTSDASLCSNGSRAVNTLRNAWLEDSRDDSWRRSQCRRPPLSLVPRLLADDYVGLDRLDREELDEDAGRDVSWRSPLCSRPALTLVARLAVEPGFVGLERLDRDELDEV
jgi:hypothetical protein